VSDADGVPWCDTCDRFYNPNSLTVDGACPKCGRIVAPTEEAAEAAEDRGAPWHFKLLIAVTAVYLSYRLFQGLFWVAHHL
jgi:predicted RNA-binding Zn-ribbon protein involved in translation (DUF1610 family)